MHTTPSQVIRRPTGNVSTFPLIDTSPADHEGRAFDGYYFFLPKRQKKQKDRAPRAFGPYLNPHAADFIRTSACALGLLESDSIP